jgi:hypothetical protein
LQGEEKYYSSITDSKDMAQDYLEFAPISVCFIPKQIFMLPQFT